MAGVTQITKLPIVAGQRYLTSTTAARNWLCCVVCCQGLDYTDSHEPPPGWLGTEFHMIEHDGQVYEWDEHDMLVPVSSATRVVNGRVYTVTHLPPSGASEPNVIGVPTRSRVTSGRVDLTLG